MAHPQASQTESLTTPPPLPDDDDDDQPFQVRKTIAVLGARAIGKTAVSIKCAMNRFESGYMPTFSATYKWKPVIDDIHYDITILDTDGQDENSFFGLQYTIGVDGYILMYSVRDEVSFDIVKAVNDKLLDTLNIQNRKGTSELPRVLIGNQTDLTGERGVPYAVAKQYADDQGIPYFETSAFTAHNVNDAYSEVLRIMQRNLRQSHLSHPLSNQPDRNHGPSQTNNRCCIQ